MLLFIREQMNSNVIRRKATGLEIFSKQQRLPRERAVLNAAGGQTLVEFAIALPLLVLILFGIIQYGFIFAAYITVRNASAFGARQAVISTNNAETAAVSALGPMLNTAKGSATLSTVTVGGIPAQSMTVTYNLPLIIPYVVIGSSTPTTMVLRATTVMR